MGWIYLSIGISCSALLTIIFKVFQKKQVHTSNAIVFNYFTASILAFLFADHPPSFSYFIHSAWALPSLALGILFITLFNVLAFTSQQIGVAEANIANKTTFIFPAIIGMLFFSELVNSAKILGVILAVFAIVFSARDKKHGDLHSSRAALLLFTLFIGGGLLDLLLSFATHYWVDKTEVGLFTGYSFLIAGTLGTLFWLITKLQNKASICKRDIVGGIGLGIPNYFSIFFFLLALKSPELESSVVFPVTNMGVIVLASLLSLLFFGEQIKKNKLIALSLAMMAIALISWANKFPF